METTTARPDSASHASNSAEPCGLSVRSFAPADADRWDALVASAVNATFLHTRRFLSYHGERFADRSSIVCDSDGRIVGVFPAALDPADPGVVVSHPGITYGGLVHDGSLGGGACLAAFEALPPEFEPDPPGLFVAPEGWS